MVPGLTNDILSLPPIPTSATSNPNLPISIPLTPTAQPQTLNGVSSVLEGVKAASAIPFVATTFSHACPTRAPGDQYRMHSVLSTFFSCPVSAEEKRRRANASAKIRCAFFSVFFSQTVGWLMATCVFGLSGEEER